MSSAVTSPLSHSEADEAHVKRIWKAFWILLILTILELALGLTIYYIDLGADSNETSCFNDQRRYLYFDAGKGFLYYFNLYAFGR